ncbi:MAG: outer membrane lipoprotein-sorting protein [Pseudomonadota bacterium]
MLFKSIKYLILILIFAPLVVNAMTAEEIINKAKSVMNQDTSKSRSKMIIVTDKGKERIFISDSFSKNKGEKNLIIYVEPSRVKGQAVLMLNNADDIWTYFPNTGRVRKMATHAKKRKMQGSDFSYEDMGSGDGFLEIFNAKRLDDEQKDGYDCYKLELTKKKDKDTSYSKVMLWIIKSNYLPVFIQYFDEKSPTLLLKELTLSDIKTIQGIPTPMKMKMENKLDNSKTEMETISIEYGVELSDNMFTEKGLKK